MKKKPPKQITVRLSHSHTAVALIILVFSLVCGVALIEKPFTAIQILNFLPSVFPITLLFIFLKWSIILDVKTITVQRVFFRKTFPYSQLKIALIKKYSGYSNIECIDLIFANRKRVTIPSTCRNYKAFKNELLKHTTVTKL